MDVQLLGSVVVSGDVLLWTRDKRLSKMAEEFGVGYSSEIH